MPFKQLKKIIFGPGAHISRDEAMKIFRRDHYKCQYCGLDGMHHFENWLVLTIDHVHPHAQGGTRKMENLVTACRPCNLMKGKRIFSSFDDAKNYVQKKREEWRNLYKEQIRTHPA
jgi:5-methylcytosine-specific restriction endonuclease McrA